MRRPQAAVVALFDALLAALERAIESGQCSITALIRDGIAKRRECTARRAPAKKAAARSVSALYNHKLSTCKRAQRSAAAAGHATMSKRILGFDEWIPDPGNVARARRAVAKLERKYRQLTGQRVEVVDGPEPLGSGALGEFFPESSRIVLYEGAIHELSLGAKAEELLHYFNYRARGLLGLTAEEIGDELIYQMEVLVERCIEKCGFVRFRSG